MAQPLMHVSSSLPMIIVLALFHFFTNAGDAGLKFWQFARIYFELGCLGIFFGILIDVDHIPHEKIFKALKEGGITAVKDRVFKDAGWLDAKHVDYFHTWQFANILIILTGVLFLVDYQWWYIPVIFYGVHIVIFDGLTVAPMRYPGTNRLGEFFGHIWIKTPFRRYMFETAGCPIPKGQPEDTSVFINFLRRGGKVAPIICLVLCLGLSIGCERKRDPTQLSDAGVVLYLGELRGSYSNPWLQNTNQYPIRVKKVWINRGEHTIWIKVFQPGEKIKLPGLSPQNGFHIFNMDGVEIGWISDYGCK